MQEDQQSGSHTYDDGAYDLVMRNSGYSRGKLWIDYELIRYGTKVFNDKVYVEDDTKRHRYAKLALNAVALLGYTDCRISAIYALLLNKWNEASTKAEAGETTFGDDGNEQEATAEDGRATITVTDDLHVTTANTLDMWMERQKRRPSTFQYGTGLYGLKRKKTKENPAGTILLEELSIDTIRVKLASMTHFVTLRGGNWKEIAPPELVIRGILAAEEWHFPVLEGLSDTPILHDDGTVVTTPGYDPISQMFYIPSMAYKFNIPETPDRSDVERAAALLREVVCDFPFTTEAGHTNFQAMLLTLVLRASIHGPVPFFGIDKPQPGSGASMLLNILSTITTGRPAAMISLPDSEAEMEKKLVTLAFEGARIVAFDNVNGEIKSAVLSMMLTAHTVKGRILGQSRMQEAPMAMVIFATGNNVRLGGDNVRRSIIARVDRKSATPWMHDDDVFVHPDLESWVIENRGRILEAVYTIAKACIQAGWPNKVREIGSYEAWSRFVGGILTYAGFDRFNTDLDEFYASADIPEEQWQTFLAALFQLQNEQTGSYLIVKQIAKWAELRDVAPDEIVAHIEKPTLARVIGDAFRYHQERRHGEYRIVKAPVQRKLTRWRVEQSR